MDKNIQNCNFLTSHVNAIAGNSGFMEEISVCGEGSPFLKTDRIGHIGLTRFFDIEPIERRSRPVNWHVDRHSHASLAQIFMLTAGKAEIELAGTTCLYEAPLLLWIPAGIAHALVYQPGSRGHVVTLGHGHVATLHQRAPQTRPLTSQAKALKTDLSDLDRIVSLTRLMPKMTAELDAVTKDACAQMILAAMTHLVSRKAKAVLTRRDENLVSAFRNAVETRFASRDTLESYLDRLKTSERILRRACLCVTGQTPKDIIQKRLATEARRLLLFTNLGAAQISERLASAIRPIFPAGSVGRKA